MFLSSKIYQHKHGFKNSMWNINIAYQDYFPGTISTVHPHSAEYQLHVWGKQGLENVF